MDIRLIPSPLAISFEEEQPHFKEEYDRLGAEIDDPVGQYLKMAKARGEMGDSDKVLVELVVALHRKVDELTKIIKNEPKQLISLKNKAKISHIGYEYFKLSSPVLEKNKKYYGRLEISLFPQRDVPVYFIGVDEMVAEIFMMHERDIKDYNAFIAARERAIIREQKATKDKK